MSKTRKISLFSEVRKFAKALEITEVEFIRKNRDYLRPNLRIKKGLSLFDYVRHIILPLHSNPYLTIQGLFGASESGIAHSNRKDTPAFTLIFVQKAYNGGREFRGTLSFGEVVDIIHDDFPNGFDENLAIKYGYKEVTGQMQFSLKTDEVEICYEKLKSMGIV